MLLLDSPLIDTRPFDDKWKRNRANELPSRIRTISKEEDQFNESQLARVPIHRVYLVLLDELS